MKSVCRQLEKRFSLDGRTVRALDGTVRELLHADAPGIVISWSETAWVDARAVPGTLGLRERDAG